MAGLTFPLQGLSVSEVMPVISMTHGKQMLL